MICMLKYIGRSKHTNICILFLIASVFFSIHNTQWEGESEALCIHLGSQAEYIQYWPRTILIHCIIKIWAKSYNWWITRLLFGLRLLYWLYRNAPPEYLSKRIGIISSICLFTLPHSLLHHSPCSQEVKTE
jgi:hypothetical protein